MQQTYFVILDHFLPFYTHTLTAPKMKIPKSKKTPGYIIILHKRTKNHDHGLYCSWVWHVMDVVVIFHFGLYFSLLPSNPPNSPKNENFKKKRKKCLDISSFYTMLYYSWDMACDRCNCDFSFWLYFSRLPQQMTAQKSWKWKKHLEISSFYTSAQ